ncbi:hypothetical protein TNCV_1110141 [Trichonephila clavipes]|nr:hypothetical protein TNCV_1110141 [Trichonephila clavipes]
MLVEATMIRAMRSSTVATGVSYTNDSTWFQKKKSKRFRSGGVGSPGSRFAASNHLSVYVAWMVTYRSRKMCWCTIVFEPHVLVLTDQCFLQKLREMGNMHTCRFLQHLHGALNHHIRLASSLVRLIVLPRATIIAIFTY